MVDLSTYKDLYLQTAGSYLEKIKSNMVIYSRNSDSKKLDEMHIAAHSMKGQSYVMGYQSTGDLCMELEYIFRALKEEKLELSSEIIEEISSALHLLCESFENIEKGRPEINFSAEKEQLERITGIKKQTI